jgi:pimeloyl-ACP methyl ester carboxylesterase
LATPSRPSRPKNPGVSVEPLRAKLTGMKSASRARRRIVRWSAVGILLVAALIGLRYAGDSYFRAVSVLVHLSKPGTNNFLTRFASHPYREEAGTSDTPQGPLRYRMYIPLDVIHPPGLILLHGIHRAGIDEPRLINFGRTLAGAGIEVMTPELQDLADYRVSARTVDTIGLAAQELCGKIKQPKVGVVGVSFAGGLALLAADRPEYAGNIGLVLAVGAHDDMTRVAHFFAANMIEKPDGSSVAFRAHEYGVLVLAYSHLEDFFSPRDVARARDALHAQLWEQPDARDKIALLSPAGRQTFDMLLHHRELLQQKFFREIDRHRDEMQAVSPHNHIGDLRVPAYLLHGTSDSVIPASETLWLAKDVPPPQLRAVLISPAMNLIHVDGEHGVPIIEQWALVDFMAQVLRAENRLVRVRR